MAKSELERVRQQRILVSLYAYAYEIANHSIISDFEYDQLSLEVAKNISISTDRSDLDEWFRENFNPSTGMWIYNHPELDLIKRNYNWLYGSKRNR